MSKRRKGLSFEEKRERVSDVFVESRDVLTLKEVEKIASKTKGVVLQSVKEVLDSLVADNLVFQEKIGSANYFWMFPSEAARAREARSEQLLSDISGKEERVVQLQARLKDAKGIRVESSKRKRELEELNELRKRIRECDDELVRYKENDPEELKRIVAETVGAKAAANHWTDNIWTVKSFCAKKFGMEARQFDTAFGIDEDFDYLE